MSETTIQVYPDATALAQTLAARLVARIVDAQSKQGTASIVLAGGRTAGATYSVVRHSADRDAIDWSRIDLWWVDERFLPHGHPDRNETQARTALLDHMPLEANRLHPMPSSDGPDGDHPDAAAARYARELSDAGRPHGARLPRFDLIMLSIGEDGHIASVPPEQQAAQDGRSVAAVRNFSKPPPTRLTLTIPTINTADDVWIIAAEADKAKAVSLAMAPDHQPAVPAAQVRGVTRTHWLLTVAAAAEMPSGVPPTATS